MLKREELLEKLDVVSTGLSSVDLIAAMTHLWFDGKMISASNDYISVAADLETEFVGGVPGRLLLDLLKTAQAKDVVFETKDESVIVRVGKSKLKLPFLASDKRGVAFPEFNKKDLITSIDLKALVEAIEVCMLSAGADALSPSQYNFSVTIKPTKSGLFCYATDDATLARAFVPCEEIPEEITKRGQVIIPASFCREFIRVCQKPKAAKFYMSGDSVGLKAGPYRLHGHLIRNVTVPDFESVIAKIELPTAKNSAKVPKAFEAALDRASLVSGRRMDWEFTKVSISEGQLLLTTKSDIGSVTDKMKLDQQDATLFMQSRLLKRGCKLFDNISFQSNCAVFGSKDSLFVVSSAKAPQ